MTADKGDKMKRAISTLMAVVAVAFLAYVTYLSIPSFGAISDLPEYYSASHLVLNGRGASVFDYDAMEKAQQSDFPSFKRMVPLYVLPPGLMLIAPLALVPSGAVPILWKLFLFACLAGGIAFTRASLDMTYRQTCYLIAGVAFSDACFEAVRIDQLAPLLLLGLSGAIYFLKERNDIAAGLLLSLLILKPQQILPFAAYLVAARRWKAVVVAASAVALMTIVAVITIGAVGFHNYSEMVRSPLSLQYMQPALTATFRGQMLRFFPGQAHMILIASLALEMLSVGVGLFFGSRWRRREDAVLLGALTMIPLAIVFSIHCHDYDFLLLVPSVVIFFLDTVVDFNAILKLLVMVCGMTFMTGVAVEIHYDYLLKGGAINVWFWQLLVFAVVVLIVAYRQTLPTKLGMADATDGLQSADA